MEMVSSPSFQKLWGRIDSKLKKGKYSVKVDSKFNAKVFNGTKSIVFETSSIAGTKMLFSIFTLAAAGVCFLLIIFLTIFRKKLR